MPTTEAEVIEYLKRHGEKDMLRFLTAGSVDDGKSTLIGRLLYDSKMIYEDQLAAVIEDSATHGTTNTDFDPALLTDGLKAEREQGITIDVAYRYFSTDKRNFIIADTPGHEQYTRNMATGGSTCDLAVILIDARHGILEQTRRHSFIASLLGIRHLAVCVNKMDLVDYSQEVFERIRSDYEGFAAKLEDVDLHFIPISALLGDNVVDPSENMPWFQGGTLLYYLETVPVATDRNLIDMRFPVQYVLRPDLNYRGYCGTVASGVLRKGDEIVALPSGARTRVAGITTFEGDVAEAYPPMAVTVTVEDEVDVSRGDMLIHPNNRPHVGQDFEALVVWMNDEPMKLNGSYLVKSTTNLVPAAITDLHYRFDINSLHRLDADTLNANEIGRVAISTHRKISFDPYQRNRSTGCIIIVDRNTNATVGAGMILDREKRAAQPVEATAEPKSEHIRREASTVSADERRALLKQKPTTLWLTGLSGSGKSTIAQDLERSLFDRGQACFILDGDNIRHGLNRDLGFSAGDRTENIRRVSEVAGLLNDAGLIVITSFISPYREDRAKAREIIGDERFVEVHIDTPIEVCESRDPKGLYKKARAGEITQFTGIDAPYEAPDAADLVLQTADTPVAESTRQIIAYLQDQGLLKA
ncbi:MAG: sulfate adenylyltransferase subunit CysN [Verrucomicrobia bacterium]|nr:sulfate adenylyltransferase subunit CysN [Verrucomicrobiota bacterium]MBT7066766.1 sulfate adenylyltransferase subunit CysN [Verrucomicrobiota bacterium]MBT7700930.1 sulfate adenylyltransferase subunit CysN [Verrucomicrobiota bacterium]